MSSLIYRKFCYLTEKYKPNILPTFGSKYRQKIIEFKLCFVFRVKKRKSSSLILSVISRTVVTRTKDTRGRVGSPIIMEENAEDVS